LLYAEDSPRNGGSEAGGRDEDSSRLERQDERLAAFDAAVAEIAVRVLPAYRAADGWLERTRASLLALLGALDERPVVARALVIDSIAWGPVVLERRGELLEALAGALEEARGEVEPFAAPPETTGENLVGASLSWVHKRLTQESGPLVELAPSLMSMIVHPYLGDEAAQHELEHSPAALGAQLVAGEGRGTVADPAHGPISPLRRVPS
jgi:hypothetical protein